MPQQGRKGLDAEHKYSRQNGLHRAFRRDYVTIVNALFLVVVYFEKSG